ncbi:MAG: hypothetical protein ACM3SY_14730 [Candidatus Omnitrophota bacterium]
MIARPTPNTRKSSGVMVVIGLVSFILIFIYLSLNLKNVDSGYNIQDLINHRKELLEEIDRLKSKKANLLNLQRVEKEAIEQLGYAYPDETQIIRVYEDEK